MFSNENHDTELLGPVFASVDGIGIAGQEDIPERSYR